METAQPAALPIHAMSASLPPPQITHTPDRQYEFELTQTGVLGSGAHGVVRVARDVNTGQAVAIKVMATSMLGSMAKELIAQSKVRHPNVVQLMGTQVDLDQKRVFMVMELCSGGELFDRIAECGKLEEDAAKRYLRQMADGINHCHALNVFHRDLKPENILLDAGDNVKIADFGLASIVRAKDGHVDEGSNFLQYTKCGSIMYAAPEVLTSSSKTGYSAAKADVWSLGIILYSMLSGALPFQVALATRCQRYARVLVLGMESLCTANGFPQGASELLCRMLESSPEKRCSIEDVLSSAWLQPATETPQNVVPATYKWCRLLEIDGASPQKRKREDGDDVRAKAKRESIESKESNSSKETIQTDASKLDDGGVNGMLVRSLGWVRLPAEKESMVAEVTRALDTLGVNFSVVRGELSDVVWVRDGQSQEPHDTPESSEGITAAGQLTVRIHIHQNQTESDEKSDIHIERQAGDVLQFHSFYRDVRHQLSGANGWRAELGRYAVDADS